MGLKQDHGLPWENFLPAAGRLLFLLTLKRESLYVTGSCRLLDQRAILPYTLMLTSSVAESLWVKLSGAVLGDGSQFLCSSHHNPRLKLQWCLQMPTAIEGRGSRSGPLLAVQGPLRCLGFLTYCTQSAQRGSYSDPQES